MRIIAQFYNSSNFNTVISEFNMNACIEILLSIHIHRVILISWDFFRRRRLLFRFALSFLLFISELTFFVFISFCLKKKVCFCSKNFYQIKPSQKQLKYISYKKNIAMQLLYGPHLFQTILDIVRSVPTRCFSVQSSFSPAGAWKIFMLI